MTEGDAPHNTMHAIMEVIEDTLSYLLISAEKKSKYNNITGIPVSASTDLRQSEGSDRKIMNL